MQHDGLLVIMANRQQRKTLPLGMVILYGYEDTARHGMDGQCRGIYNDIYTDNQTTSIAYLRF